MSRKFTYPSFKNVDVAAEKHRAYITSMPAFFNQHQNLNKPDYGKTVVSTPLHKIPTNYTPIAEKPKELLIPTYVHVILNEENQQNYHYKLTIPRLLDNIVSIDLVNAYIALADFNAWAGNHWLKFNCPELIDMGYPSPNEISMCPFTSYGVFQADSSGFPIFSLTMTENMPTKVDLSAAAVLPETITIKLQNGGDDGSTDNRTQFQYKWIHLVFRVQRLHKL